MATRRRRLSSRRPSRRPRARRLEAFDRTAVALPMHFLALAVLFSVAVSLWLKQAPAWRLDLAQMVL